MYRPLPKQVIVKTSGIEGLGLFSVCKISADVELGLTHIFDDRYEDNYIRTPLGGFINYSDTPNCKSKEHLGNLYLITIEDIKDGEELTLKYKLYNPIR